MSTGLRYRRRACCKPKVRREARPVSATNRGPIAAISTEPAYFALAYLMKL